MTTSEPSIADTNWLEPNELYLQTGGAVESDRPIYQGDVFEGVAMLQLPRTMPPDGEATPLESTHQMVMVVPHPCQCYHGDKLRRYLTVAPVRDVADYDNFGEERTGAKDKFALLDLPRRDVSAQWYVASSVADFGRLTTVPSSWLHLW